MLLTDEPELHRSEPNTLRHRLLHLVLAASPAASTRCSCAWLSTDPGHSRWPKRSPAYASSQSRPDGQHHRTRTPTTITEAPDPVPALPHAQTPIVHIFMITNADQGLTERPGLELARDGGSGHGWCDTTGRSTTAPRVLRCLLSANCPCRISKHVVEIRNSEVGVYGNQDAHALLPRPPTAAVDIID